jgi:5-methylcytosine-specific restriction protein A
MPNAAPRPCRHPGCAALVHDGTGYCSKHARPSHNWQADKQRGDSRARGYGTTWRRLREFVMQRDCGLCQPCKQQGRTTVATEVDHIVSKARGGTDETVNLQAICTDCHKHKTAKERG